MKIQKTAVINLTLSLLQLYVRINLQDINLISLQQIQINQYSRKAHQLLQIQISKLLNKGFLNDHQIILDIIQNVNPIQLCSSCDCQLNVIYLKKIQDELLQHGFKIKFIL